MGKINRETFVTSSFASWHELQVTRFTWSTGWSRWAVTIQRWQFGGAGVTIVHDGVQVYPDWQHGTSPHKLFLTTCDDKNVALLAEVIRILHDRDIAAYVGQRKAIDKLLTWPLVDHPKAYLRVDGQHVRAWPKLDTVCFVVLDDHGNQVTLPPADACWLTCRTMMQLNPSGSDLVNHKPTGAHVVTAGQVVANLASHDIYLRMRRKYMRLGSDFVDIAQPDLRPALIKYVALRELADDIHSYRDHEAVNFAKLLLASRRWCNAVTQQEVSA